MSRWVKVDGQWLHRPAWKVAINSVLRFLQPIGSRKWVVATKCREAPDPLAHPVAIGYQIALIEHE